MASFPAPGIADQELIPIISVADRITNLIGGFCIVPGVKNWIISSEPIPESLRNLSTSERSLSLMAETLISLSPVVTLIDEGSIFSISSDSLRSIGDKILSPY